MRSRAERKEPAKYIAIEVEFHGQDFSRFLLEYDGLARGVHDVHTPMYKIIETQPMQGWLWNGKLVDGTTIFVGGRIGMLLEGEWRPLNYPTTKVKESNSPISVEMEFA